MYKKIAAAMLVCTVACAGTGCSLFADESIVKFTDEYQHEDPSEMKGKEKVALKCEDFDVTLEEMVNAEAYPDTMIIDKEGNIMGLYDYEETTGLAMGWTNVEDGTYTAYEAGEEVDLGKPDESKMIDGMENVYGVSLSAEDDTTLLGYMDSAYMDEQFEMAGMSDSKTVKTYASILKQTWRLSAFG